jgi:hypothetical protein
LGPTRQSVNCLQLANTAKKQDVAIVDQIVLPLEFEPILQFFHLINKIILIFKSTIAVKDYLNKLLYTVVTHHLSLVNQSETGTNPSWQISAKV